MTAPEPLNPRWKASRAWLLVVVWTAVLWWLGSEAGSMNATSHFIGPLLRWILPDAPQPTLERIHFFLRKCAHVGGYGMLAFLTWRAILASARAARRPALLALAWVLAVAALDEVRQTTIAVRTGSPWDVGLDVGGGLLALALAMAYTRAMRAKREARQRQ